MTFYKNIHEDKFKHSSGLSLTQAPAWFYSGEIWEHRYKENGTELGRVQEEGHGETVLGAEPERLRLIEKEMQV